MPSSNFSIFQGQPNTNSIGNFLQQGIGGLIGSNITTDINDAMGLLASPFTGQDTINSMLGPQITAGNPLSPFESILQQSLPYIEEAIPQSPFANRLDYFDNLDLADTNNITQQAIDDTINMGVPFKQAPIDPINIYQEEEVPTAIEEPIVVGAPQDFLSATDLNRITNLESQVFEADGTTRAIPIETPIDTGINPFYDGATNVAQPPSMTPVAPSFGLDVGVGGYGTPTNTADFGNIGGYFTPSTTTNSPVGAPFLPTITSSTPNQAIYDYYTQPATTAAPQTTTTALPTVNSFAGFNGFGGFGGF